MGLEVFASFLYHSGLSNMAGTNMVGSRPR